MEFLSHAILLPEFFVDCKNSNLSFGTHDNHHVFIKLLCFWWYFIGGKRTVNTLLKQNSSIFVELQPTTWTFLLLWQSWERLETIFTSSLSSHGYFFYGIEILFTLITTIRTSLSLIFRFSIQFRHFILCFKLSKTI